MKTEFFSLLTGVVLLSAISTAQASDCLYAYKAKRDNPLQLHYGVIAIVGRCDTQSAQQETAARLRRNGWELLVLLERVVPSKINQYRETAGEFFLRY